MTKIDPKAVTARWKGACERPESDRKGVWPTVGQSTGTHRALSSGRTSGVGSAARKALKGMPESPSQRIRRRASVADGRTDSRSVVRQSLTNTSIERVVTAKHGSIVKRRSPAFRLGLLLRRLANYMPKPPPAAQSFRGLAIGSIACLAGILGVFALQQIWTMLDDSDVFRVESVAVKGCERASEEVMRTSLDGLVGQHRRGLDYDGITREISDDPWVADVGFDLRTGDRHLDIHIREHVPALLLAGPDDGRLWLVDPEGHPFKILEARDSADLPIVTGFDPFRFSGDPEGSALLLRRASRAMDALTGHGFDIAQVSEVRIDGTGAVLARLLSGAELWMGSDQFSHRAKRLMLLTERGLVDLDEARRIRLNFADQVVVGPPSGV